MKDEKLLEWARTIIEESCRYTGCTCSLYYTSREMVDPSCDGCDRLGSFENKEEWLWEYRQRTIKKEKTPEEDNLIFSVKTKKFKKLVTEVAQAADESKEIWHDGRPITESVHFIVKDGWIKCEASDGFVMSTRKMKVVTAKKPADFILNADILRGIVNSIDEDTCPLVSLKQVENNSITINSTDFFARMEMVEGTYMNTYTEDNRVALKYKLKTDEFLSIISMLVEANKTEDGPPLVQISNNNFSLLKLHYKNNYCDITIDLDGEIEINLLQGYISIHVDAMKLQNQLEYITDQEIFIEITHAPINPKRLRSDEPLVIRDMDNNILSLIMPLIMPSHGEE